MKILDLQSLSCISAGDNINNIDNRESWSSKASQIYQDYGPSKTTLRYIGGTFAVIAVGYFIGKKMNSMFPDYLDPEFD